MDKDQSIHTRIALVFSRVPLRIWITFAALCLVTVAVLTFVPTPEIAAIRNIVHSTGTWAPATYIVLMVLCTQLPIPRTAWTVAAGVIFGVKLGISVALLGLIFSAALSLTLVKTLGRRTVAARAKDNATLESLLGIVAARGWIAVLGLRMVPAVPFSILNYACGAVMMPMGGFLAATLLGSAPNTIATVLLADAAATGTPRWMLLLTIPIYLVGIVLSLREASVWRRTLLAEKAAPSP